jgi:hypothetical protein
VIISGDVLQGASVDLRGIEQVLSFADADEQLPTLDVASGATLDLTAAQASGKSITGLGSVRVHGLNADTNLDGVQAANLTVVFDANADISARTLPVGVDAYELSDHVEVTFDVGHLEGINITVNGPLGNGAAVLNGNITSGTFDWRNLPSNLNFGEDKTIEVAFGAILKITAAQADTLSEAGFTITGAGTVEVTTVTVLESLDLSGILTDSLLVTNNAIILANEATLKVNNRNFDMPVSKQGATATVEIAGDVANNESLDLTVIPTGIAVDLLGAASANMQLGEGAYLYARVEQLVGEVVQGAGTIVLSGNAAAGLDLSDIEVNLDVSGVTGLNLTDSPVTLLPNYASTQTLHTLTLSYAQVTGQTYGAGPFADVVIKAIAPNAETSSAADLQGLTAHKITAIVDSDVTFTGNLGNAEVSVNDNKVLTTTAAIATGKVISGLGTLNIPGDITTAVTIDLTQVSTQYLTFLDGNVNAIAVANGATLKINADVATNGMAITGAGTVDMQNGHTENQYNFDGVTATHSYLTFSNDGVLNVGTVLTGVDKISLAAGTTEMSASQANGRVFEGLGGVKIHDADGTQTFNGTAYSDTFLGQGSNNDAVDFSKKDGDGNDISGSDTVRFSGDASDMTVTGLTFGALVDNPNADVLDFSNLANDFSNVNHTPTSEVYEWVSVTDNLTISFKMTGYVVGVTGGTAENAAGVANLFANYDKRLNKTVDDGSDMVFMVANAAGDTHVWHWHDVLGTTGRGDVQASELIKMATLIGVNQSEIIKIEESNIHFIV